MSVRSSRSSRTPQSSSITPRSSAIRTNRPHPPTHSKAQRKVEAREREMMVREDYWSQKMARMDEERKAREEREVRERERLRVLKDGWGSPSAAEGGSGSGRGGSSSSHDVFDMISSHDFQVEDQQFLAAIWLVQGAKGAARKESSWVMRTSESLFVERRRVYNEVCARIAQLQKDLEVAEKQLRSLRVKMTIERRAKEAAVEQYRVPLREACEQEAVS